MQETAEAKLALKRAEVKELLSKLDLTQRQLSEHNAEAELKSHQTGLVLSHKQQLINRYLIQPCCCTSQLQSTSRLHPCFGLSASWHAAATVRHTLQSWHSIGN